jgi:hypothetical protein
MLARIIVMTVVLLSFNDALLILLIRVHCPFDVGGSRRRIVEHTVGTASVPPVVTTNTVHFAPIALSFNEPYVFIEGTTS